MSSKKTNSIRVDSCSLVGHERTEDLLAVSSKLLAEVNRELDARFMDLPEDVRALLVQKGALTQTIIRELTRLIERAADKAKQHEALLDHCAEWQREFFVPLKAQSDGEQVDKEIYLRDLEQMIEEVGRVLAAREG
jgi:transcriptional regulator with PAS, ATPase and Fis domain